MTTAAVRRYWDALDNQCVCGAFAEHVHHIIHVNGQRITKDDWLVVKLCARCHQSDDASVHNLGGERQFLEHHGYDLVQLATLRRHNYEVRAR